MSNGRPPLFRFGIAVFQSQDTDCQPKWSGDTPVAEAAPLSIIFYGDDPEELKSFAWFEGNPEGHPHPVGQRKPNAWNLFDMAGNVWEWCNDNYDAKYYRESPTENPHGPKQGEKRVLQGGPCSASSGSCTSWVRNCDQMGLNDVCLTMDSNDFRCVRKK